MTMHKPEQPQPPIEQFKGGHERYVRKQMDRLDLDEMNVSLALRNLADRLEGERGP